MTEDAPKRPTLDWMFMGLLPALLLASLSLIVSGWSLAPADILRASKVPAPVGWIAGAIPSQYLVAVGALLLVALQFVLVSVMAELDVLSARDGPSGTVVKISYRPIRKVAPFLLRLAILTAPVLTVAYLGGKSWLTPTVALAAIIGTGLVAFVLAGERSDEPYRNRRLLARGAFIVVVAALAYAAGRPAATLFLQGTDLSSAPSSWDEANDPGIPVIDLAPAAPRILQASHAKLVAVKMQGLVLDSADITDADLRRATLTGLTVADGKLDGERAILRRANLARLSAPKARLAHADLSRAVLEHANLREALLVGAKLSYATLDGADLSKADLTGADLDHATLRGANLCDTLGVKASTACGDGKTRASVGLPCCPGNNNAELGQAPDAAACNQLCPEAPSSPESPR